MLELKELVDDPNTEAALAKLAQEEMAEHRDQVQQLQKQLLTLLVPKDVADDANAIIEVRAGRKTSLCTRSALAAPVLTVGPLVAACGVSVAGAGTGGSEAAIFARELSRMYERYATVHGWRYELMNVSVDEATQGFRVRYSHTICANWWRC